MTDLPVPANAVPTPAPNPETDRLVTLYLRTLTSPQTIKTYNTEIRMFLAYVVGELGKDLGSKPEAQTGQQQFWTGECHSCSGATTRRSHSSSRR